MLHIGFTGTRKGMTHEQTKKVRKYFVQLHPFCLHHGDCIGADDEANSIARGLFNNSIIHPPVDPKYRAYCPSDKSWEPKRYIVRNHDIVDESDILVATPKQKRETRRSGTWATIRYARKQEHIKAIYIIYPDGTSSLD